MDHPVARAVPHLRNPARRQVNTQTSRDRPVGNLRTALVLASIALVFFAGVIAKYWLFGA